MNLNDNCIFCKIIKKEIPSKIVMENKGAIAFLDLNPIANGHTIVIPKNHCCDLATCNKQDLTDVINLVQDVSRLLESSKLKPWGFNYLSNQGNIAGQEVFHFHMHVIPKYAKDEGFMFNKGKLYLLPIDEVYEYVASSSKQYNKLFNK